MNARLEQAIRIAIGSVIGVIVAYIILKIGDYNEPAVQPSLLYQEGSGVWVAGFIWWTSAGLAIGLAAGLITVRMETARTFITNAFSALGAIIILVAILSYQRFALSPDQLDLGNYLIVYGSNIVYFMYFATFPAIFGILIAQILIAPFAKRRSALPIMPDELRERFLQEQAEHKQTPLLQRVFGHSKKTA